MQADLENIIVPKRELQQLTGLNDFPWQITKYHALLLDLLNIPKTEREGEINAAIQAFGDRNQSWFLEPILKILLTLIEAMGLETSLKQAKNRSLRNLLIDVKNHNKLIYQIHVLDQLKSIGNAVALDERDKVIEALKITRANLIRSLQTERILRENPGFRPENFSVDVSSLRSLQVSEQSSEYGKFLNEALQIGMSIQDEIEVWQKQT
jgi:hypothetical protein